MKAIITLLLTGGFGLFAANEITLTTGAATTSITGQGTTVTAINLATVGAGNTFCVTVNINNTDFTLAGFEFQVFYPPFLTLLSTSNSDWANDTGAVFKIGSGLTGDTQKLPADSAGTPNASQVNNGLGTARFGMLFTDANDRLAPTAGATPIAELCFQVNSNWVDNTACTSLLEAIRVFTVPSGSTTLSDIFANDAAQRIQVVSSTPTDAFSRQGAALYLGDSGAPLKGDWSGNNSRTAADAAGCLRCASFGLASSQCTTGAGAGLSVSMDYNCSGSVTPADAAGLLKLSVGLSNRPGKNLEYYSGLGKSGTLIIDSEGQLATMAANAFLFDNLKLGEATIDEDARKAGWMIVQDLVDENVLQYILVNPRMDMVKVPRVYISYENPESGRVALVESQHQKTDYSMFDYTPLVEDHAAGAQGDRRGTRIEQ
jgi:hypothetical protein